MTVLTFELTNKEAILQTYLPAIVAWVNEWYPKYLNKIEMEWEHDSIGIFIRSEPGHDIFFLTRALNNLPDIPFKVFLNANIEEYVKC